MVARLLSLLFLISTVHAQALYCGQDSGLSSKVTLSNLVSYSEQFDNAYWTKTGISITADSVIAPDGTLTADTYTSNLLAATNARYYYQTVGMATGSSSARRISIYLKQGTHRYVRIASQYPATSYVDVDIRAGTILRSGSTNISQSITMVGNGWYRVVFTHTPNGNTEGVNTWMLKDAATDAYTNWSSAGTENFFVWGEQVNFASSPSDYLTTTASAATLGPLCAAGTTQSPTDPTRCIALGNGSSRRW